MSERTTDAPYSPQLSLGQLLSLLLLATLVLSVGLIFAKKNRLATTELVAGDPPGDAPASNPATVGGRLVRRVPESGRVGSG